MNTDKQKASTEQSRRNPFWACLIVFVLLGCDYGFRLVNLWDQREQLSQAVLMQAQNAGALAQARQLEARLEALSLELLQVAKTNAAAKQIVQDFNIQWTPGPAASVPAPAAGKQQK
jgi:hypothetical protein